MATIPNPASPKFPDVYQIETSDPVQGGPNGISNKSTKDLVERTQYLNLNKANTATKIVAGNGLTGGGTLGSDTTVTLGTPGGLTDKSNNAVTETGHTHSLQKSSTAVAGIVQLNDTLTSDSITLALTAKQGKALKSELDTLGTDKAATATKIVAGNGLTGGGTLGADTTVTLGTPGALTATSTNAVTATSHTHTLPSSSTAVAGIVKLNDTLTSDSNALALTAKQGKVLKAQVDKAISFFTADEALPTTDIGPIWHGKYASIMEWVVFSLNGAKYTGYASVGIGIVTAESQPTLRTGYIRSGAASYNQATYPILWNWAKHNGLVQNTATWKAKTGFYRDNGDGTFTPPDLTDQHIRFSGANREVGTYQGDAMRKLTGSIHLPFGYAGATQMNAAGGGVFDTQPRTHRINFTTAQLGQTHTSPASNVDGYGMIPNMDSSRQVPTALEVQVVTTAFLPAIKH